MGMGRAVTRLAALGAAVAGVVFFWRRRQGPADGSTTPPSASDRPTGAA
jgi:hypothetical protein